MHDKKCFMNIKNGDIDFEIQTQKNKLINNLLDFIEIFKSFESTIGIGQVASKRDINKM